MQAFDPSGGLGADAQQASAPTNWMTYTVEKDLGAWRIVALGARCGCFDSREAALTQARKLAREAAALGRPACLLHRDESGHTCRETFPARRH